MKHVAHGCYGRQPKPLSYDPRKDVKGFTVKRSMPFTGFVWRFMRWLNGQAF